MAIYNLNMNTSKYGATSKYDYNNREGIYSKGTQGEELIFKSSENMPSFAESNPRNFWIVAEEQERTNGTLYRKVEFSLPCELSDEDNIKLSQDFAKKLLKDKHTYSLSIHKKRNSTDDLNNIHCHIIFSERILDGEDRTEDKFFSQPNGGGLRKERDWWTRAKLYETRELWEEVLNERLIENNIEPVSCRTLISQQEEAIKNGDFLKAEQLNRNPINIDGKILHKFETNPEGLTLDEIESLQFHFENLKIKSIKDENYKIQLEKIKFDTSTEMANEIDNNLLKDEMKNDLNQLLESSSKENLFKEASIEITGKDINKCKKDLIILEEEKPNNFKNFFVKWDREEEYKEIKQYLNKYDTEKFGKEIINKSKTLFEKTQEKINLLNIQLSVLDNFSNSQKMDNFNYDSLNIDLLKTDDFNYKDKGSLTNLKKFEITVEKDITRKKILNDMENIEKKINPNNLNTLVLQSLTRGKYSKNKIELEKLNKKNIHNTKELQKIKVLEKFFDNLNNPMMKSKVIAKTHEIKNRYETTYNKLNEDLLKLNDSLLSYIESYEQLNDHDKEELNIKSNKIITDLKVEIDKVDKLVIKQFETLDKDKIKIEIYNNISSNSYSKIIKKIELDKEELKNSTKNKIELDNRLKYNIKFIEQIKKIPIENKVNEVESIRRGNYKSLRIYQDSLKGKLKFEIDKNNFFYKQGIKKHLINSKGDKILKGRGKNKGTKSSVKKSSNGKGKGGLGAVLIKENYKEDGNSL